MVTADAMLFKLLELDPNYKFDNDKRDLEHVRRYMKEADVAYNNKDFRKVTTFRFVLKEAVINKAF